MEFSQLVLVYTLDCPLRCDFCSRPMEEYESAKISKDEAIRYINEASELGEVKRIIFNGGEPFLHHAELVGVLDACKGLISASIVTSCYWAETREKALEKLRPLVERGLDELSCSTDPTHQAFVPASFAKNAVESGLELGLTCEIISVFRDTTSKIEDFIKVSNHPRLRLHRRLAIPQGRWRRHKVTWQDYNLPCSPSQTGGCNTRERCAVTIYPDGEVYPCCAGELNFQGRLSFGNAKKEPLKTILGRMWADTYIRLMFRHGCGAIYGLARWKFPHLLSLLPKDDDLVSMCQLCARIHGDGELMESLRPLLDYAERLVEVEQRLEGHKKGGNNN